MLSAESVKASYRRALKERVVIRRYTGAGSNTVRPRFDAYARARVLVGSQARELIADIKANEQAVVVLSEDLMAQGLWPVKSSDFACVRGRQDLALVIEENRTAQDGSPVALVLRVGG